MKINSIDNTQFVMCSFVFVSFFKVFFFNLTSVSFVTLHLFSANCMSCLRFIPACTVHSPVPATKGEERVAETVVLAGNDGLVRISTGYMANVSVLRVTT